MEIGLLTFCHNKNETINFRLSSQWQFKHYTTNISLWTPENSKYCLW
jgi:hypothetical protein